MTDLSKKRLQSVTVFERHAASIGSFHLKINRNSGDMHLLTFFIICFVWCIDGFTRKFRSVDLALQKPNERDWVLTFDPIPTNVDEQVSKICDDLGCIPDGTMLIQAVGDQIRTKLLMGLRSTYSSYLHRSFNNEWLQYADIVSQTQYISTRYDVININAGNFFHFSPLCNDQKNWGKTECAYAKIIGPLINETTSTSELSDAQLNSLIYLFNDHLYDHCEAACYYYLNAIFKSFYETKLGLNTSLPSVEVSVEQYERIVRLSIMLTEMSLAQGLVNVSTVYSMLTFFCYEMNQHYRPGVEPISYIARLRLIVSFPSMPSDKESLVLYRAQMVEDLHSLTATIKRDSAMVSLTSMLEVIPSTNFHMAHQGLNDREIQVALASAFSALCPELLYTPPDLLTERLIDPVHNYHTIRPNPDDPAAGPYILKIAFLSSHFYDHSIGRILIDMFLVMKKFQLQLDSSLYSIQVMVYYLDRNTFLDRTDLDPTSGEKLYRLAMYKDTDDVIVQSLERHFGRNFVRLPQNVEVARSQLAREKLDFLFYADVGMEFASYLLAFSRLATYQAAWWGHPITTGINSIDYFISIDEEVPSAHEHYSEQLVRLNGINTVPLQKFNRTVLQDKFRDQDMPAGLTTKSKISLVIGRLFKIHPDFIAILVDLLLETIDDEDVVLVFIAEKIHHYNAHIHGLIKSRLAALNVSASVAYRCIRKVRYVHYHNYFELISVARVVLDTWPYGGCLTAHDALSHQAPLVTLPSEFIRGRFTLALYNQMQHTDLIAENATHYIQLAVKLLRNDTIYNEQLDAIDTAYTQRFNQNSKVALDWMQFVLRLFQ